METYLQKIVASDKEFRNMNISEFSELVNLSLIEINLFRLKNLFQEKSIDKILHLKNVKPLIESRDYLTAYIIEFENKSKFLIAIADTAELNDDPFIILKQQL